MDSSGHLAAETPPVPHIFPGGRLECSSMEPVNFELFRLGVEAALTLEICSRKEPELWALGVEYRD